jgi:hypothetical protein
MALARLPQMDLLSALCPLWQAWDSSCWLKLVGVLMLLYDRSTQAPFRKI